MFKKLSKNMEDIKKNSSKLVMKSTMCEINTLFKVNSKLDIMEEKIGELEGIAIETVQNETENFKIDTVSKRCGQHQAV